MSYIQDNSNIVTIADSSVSSSTVYDIRNFDSVCYQVVYTDATPTAKTFVAANVTINPANTITITAHGFNTGLKVALSGTNLPTGLSATNYWIIVIDANTVSVASSLVNAVAGTAVHITGAGTTSDAALTPASLSVVFKLQQGNVLGGTYYDVSGDTVTITGSGSTFWAIASPPAAYHNFLLTPTTGAVNITVTTCSRAIVNQ